MHFRRCIGYVDIAGRSPAMGRQTSAWWEKQAIFEQNASISLTRWCWWLQRYFRQITLTCLQLIFTSNWSGFVSVSWAFLFSLRTLLSMLCVFEVVNWSTNRQSGWRIWILKIMYTGHCKSNADRPCCTEQIWLLQHSIREVQSILELNTKYFCVDNTTIEMHNFLILLKE